MEPPLSVQLEINTDVVHATCPELDLTSSGKDEQSALENLADRILKYLKELEENEELRNQSPHKEHFEFYVEKMIPYIQGLEQEASSDSIELPIRITEIIHQDE